MLASICVASKWQVSWSRSSFGSPLVLNNPFHGKVNYLFGALG